MTSPRLERGLAARFAASRAAAAALWAVLMGLVAGVPASARAKVVDAAETGPFRLQVTERRGDLQFSANTGFYRPTICQCELHLRGQLLAVPDGRGGTRTVQRAAWVLADAPQPAVLVGGDAWVLVTEHDGQAQLRTLSTQEAGTWQWVDLPEGPGQEGRNRVQVESRALTLRGAGRLLLDRKVLLDVRTLRAHTLAQPVPPGFRRPQSGMASGLMGVSPDGRAVAFHWVRGSRDSLVVISSTERDESALLPFDEQQLPDGGAYASGPKLMAHFTWQAQPGDGLPRLVLRDLPASPWQIRYLVGLRTPRVAGQARPAFTLAPVRATLGPAVLEALVAGTDLRRAPAQPGDPAPSPAAFFARVRSPLGVPAWLRFEAGSRTLTIESEHDEAPHQAELLVEFLGRQVEEHLRAQRWREHLAAP